MIKFHTVFIIKYDYVKQLKFGIDHFGKVDCNIVMNLIKYYFLSVHYAHIACGGEFPLGIDNSR